MTNGHITGTFQLLLTQYMHLEFASRKLKLFHISSVHGTAIFGLCLLLICVREDLLQYSLSYVDYAYYAMI
jgi:hypothetical protein